MSNAPNEGREEKKEANACPVLVDYWCFDRACGIDHNTQCMMINPRNKIYVDGGKQGDYIQQNIAFRREMEMNYAKTLDENQSLRDQLSIEKEFRGNLLKDISNLSDQLSKERENNKRLEEGILKFVHHWRIFFYSPKVGQPPNLSDLESLISKASELDKN